MSTPRTRNRKKVQKELQLENDPESQADAAPQSGIATDQPPTGDARKGTSQRVVQVSETYSGPLPHPAIIKQYNEIQPDFAERLLRMAEDQQAHRHKIESDSSKARISGETQGRWIGLTIVLAVLACSTYLITKGYPIIGLGASLGPLAAVVSVFIAGRRSKRRRESSHAEADSPDLPAATE